MGNQEGVNMSNVLERPVTDLELSHRTQNKLAEMEIWKIKDIVVRPKEEFLCVPGFGRKSLNELSEVLKGLNLDFGMEQSDIEDKTQLYQTLHQSIADKCTDTLRVSFDRIIKKKHPVDVLDAIREHRKILNTLEQAVLNAAEN